MRISAKQRKLLSLVVTVLVAVVVWWSQQGDDTSDRQADDRSSQSASPTPGAASPSEESPSGDDDGSSNEPAPSSAAPESGEAVDPETGLRWIDEEQLPAEALETLDLIDAGGPYPYDRDGITFENREGILPDQATGHYHEYTVPTPGEDDRGARRIVTGDDDEFFWTADHYESFERIRR